jgi:hypothetical protein
MGTPTPAQWVLATGSPSWVPSTAWPTVNPPR